MSGDTARMFAMMCIGSVTMGEIQRGDWWSAGFLVAAASFILLAIWLDWRQRWRKR